MKSLTNEELLSRFEHLEKGIDTVLQQFNDKLKYDSHKQQQIDRLHSELQEHKANLLAGALRPIFSNLIRLYNDTLKISQIDDLDSNAPPLPPEKIRGILLSFAEDIELVLLDNGVQPFHDKAEGDRFNAKRQQAIDFTPTSEERDHGTIAKRISPGYEYGKFLIKKELVIVKQLAIQTPSSKRAEQSREPANELKIPQRNGKGAAPSSGAPPSNLPKNFKGTSASDRAQGEDAHNDSPLDATVALELTKKQED